MSRRTILSLVASAIIGLGIAGTISTDASAYGAGLYRGGVYRCGYYLGVRPGVAVGIGAAAVDAAAIGAAAASAAGPVGCPYGYYYYAPHNRCAPTP